MTSLELHAQWFNSTFDKEVAEVCNKSLNLLLQEFGTEVCVVKLYLYYIGRIILFYLISKQLKKWSIAPIPSYSGSIFQD
jgi:hypothetical protein